MERSVEDRSTDTNDEDLSVGDQLDSLCEYYMSIGVPYEEFWYGDYCRLKYYEAVYLQQRKAENERMWMMGAYVYSAFGTVMANAFRSKGSKVQDYIQKPIQFFPLTEAEQKVEAEQLRQRVIDNLNRFKEEWDKQENVRRTADSESGNHNNG